MLPLQIILKNRERVKKLGLVLFFSILHNFVNAQTITFGESSTFTIGDNTVFYSNANSTTFNGELINDGRLSLEGEVNFNGPLTVTDILVTMGDAGFEGELTNNGVIESAGDLDFKANKNVGSLRFTGTGDQNLTSQDTLFVADMEVNKTGNLVVMSEQVLVSGSLDIESGVVQTDDIDDLIVTGESSEAGDGYVEGKLVGLSAGSPVSFPMGVNGFKNSITLTGTSSGSRLIVDCLIPESETLLPTDEMVGIADEVEWQIRTVSGSTETTITANFSGLDFINFSNGEQIRADAYAPALVIIQAEDTVYSILNSSEATPENAASTETSGRIVSTSTVTIDTTITRINVAWLPFKEDAEMFVPNAFSPSGFYEENRVFRPFFAGGTVTSVTMRVFNAYNDEVYSYSESGTDIDLSLIGWDGTLGSGQPAEEGVYYYQIVVVSPDLDNPEMGKDTGTVLLVNE